MKSRPIVFMSLLSLLGLVARAEPLKIGADAPAISGVTDESKTLNLADVYKANDYTLVWFYPKALTGGCTKQGCSLRDAAADLKAKGVTIVGVSVDPVEKQKEFKEVNHFPYPLISDPEQKILNAFGQSGGKMAAREAYLINKEGKVVYHDEKQTEKQAEMVLAFLNGEKKG